MTKVLCICLSSTIQRSISFSELNLTKVNRSKHYRQDASGKAINSQRVLNHLEPGCAMGICPIGKENKTLFKKLAADEKLNIKTIEIPGYTRECWTLLDSKKGTTTELVVGEPVIPLSEKQKTTLETKLFKLINKSLTKVQAVILAGSRPEIWAQDLYAKIAKLCIENEKIFLADYIGKDMELTLNATTPSIIKINEEEFAKTFGLKNPDDEAELKAAIIQKSQELQNIIIVTRGTKSTLGANKGTFASVETEKVKAINTTACGDSFNAGFIYEYIMSLNFEDALKKGTWCASRNAEIETPGGLY